MEAPSHWTHLDPFERRLLKYLSDVVVSSKSVLSGLPGSSQRKARETLRFLEHRGLVREGRKGHLRWWELTEKGRALVTGAENQQNKENKTC